MSTHNALYLLWKEAGVSSRRALQNFARKDLDLRLKGSRGIGHGGTLDPFARGLLLVGVGEGTKLLNPLVGLDKTYIATFLFGVSSPSFDCDERIEFRRLKVKEDYKIGVLDEFLHGELGEFEQEPPAYSAVKVDGVEAYKRVRYRQETIQLKPRKVKLLSARTLKCGWQDFCNQRLFSWQVELRVGAGTYIRALARDWGRKLFAAEGLLSELDRTAIGRFSMHEKDRYKKLNIGDLKEYFQLDYLNAEQARRLKLHGQSPKLELRERNTLILDPEGQVIAWRPEASTKLGRVFRDSPL